ncbi:MAG: NarK/NasA family nitrate transporter [Euryarchaeota archaeon]|nr:NarK/NasA family nitrate transporter [Euryarchaeota archaeon]
MTGLAAALRSGSPRNLAAALVHFEMSFMVWLLMGALAVYISTDLGLSPSEKGLLVALPILGGSLMRIPVGFLADRNGPKRTGMGLLLLTLLPPLMAWIGGADLRVLLLSGLLLGAPGASFAVAMALASRSYPKEHAGLANGIVGEGNTGSVLALLVLPRLAEAVGWRNTFALGALFVALTGILFALLAREPPLPPRVPWKRAAAPIHDGDSWRFCLLYGVTFGGFVGLSGFLPLLLHDQYGLDGVAAGTTAAAIVLCGSLIRPLGGWVADLVGGRRMLIPLLALVALAAGGTSTLPPLPLALPLFMALMACLGLGNGAQFQIIPRRFPREIGFLSGLVGAFGGLGGFILAYSLGLLKETTGSYGAGLALFGLVSLLGLAVLIVRKEWSIIAPGRLPAVQAGETA